MRPGASWDPVVNEVISIAVRFQAEAANVAVCRRILRSFDQWVAAATMERAVLVLSEIVTNAIRHGSSGSRATIDLDVVVTEVSLHLTVRDNGPPFPADGRDAEPGSDGGFGLPIVGRLADAVTVKRVGDGNEVSVALDFARDLASG